MVTIFGPPRDARPEQRVNESKVCQDSESGDPCTQPHAGPITFVLFRKDKKSDRRPLQKTINDCMFSCFPRPSLTHAAKVLFTLVYLSHHTRSHGYRYYRGAEGRFPASPLPENAFAAASQAILASKTIAANQPACRLFCLFAPAAVPENSFVHPLGQLGSWATGGRTRSCFVAFGYTFNLSHVEAIHNAYICRDCIPR